MNACYIHDGFFSERDGEIYCNVINYNVIANLLRHFETVDVVARHASYMSNHVRLDLPNVRTKLVGSVTSLSGVVLNAASAFRQISLTVGKSDFVYCGLGPNALFALILAKRWQKKHLVWVGGCIREAMRSSTSLYKRLLAGVAGTLVKRMTESSDNVMYVAPYLEDRYPSRGRCCIWSDTLISSDDVGEVMASRFKRMIARNRDEFTIGLIGYTHNKIKGIDTAIKALALLEDCFRLRVLGGGDNQWLVDLSTALGVKDRVEFCGQVRGGEAVWKWLDNVDIYIQPSTTEGLPKATVEAMSRGCPVIATNVGGLPDIVHHEWMHYVGDHSRLADMIKQLSSSEEVMRESVKHSFHISLDFRPRLLEEKFDSFIREILSTKPENVHENTSS